MKTIVHYKTGSYLPITENWIYSQIKNLKQYKPIVYCLDIQNLDVYSVKYIKSLNFKRGKINPSVFFNKTCNRLLGFYPSFFYFLHKDKPDLVHAHYGPGGYSFLPLKKKFKIPLITTFYGYDVNMLPNQEPIWRKRYKRLFQEGDCFFTEGSHMKKCLVELGCPKEKVIVQHLGVDLDRIRFMPRKLNDDEEVKILMAGSFREKKGIPYAIEAIGKLKQNNPNLKIKATLIGDSSGQPREEKEKKKIFEAIDKYKLREIINLMGYQPYSVFIEEMYKHHIFLSPSVTASDGDTEGGAPVAIIEASASGMPVISTLHCDIPEVILNDGSGYCVPEQDIDALADKLEFLTLNPDIWMQMGSIGRGHIENNYDIKKQVINLEKIYGYLIVKNKKNISRNIPKILLKDIKYI